MTLWVICSNCWPSHVRHSRALPATLKQGLLLLDPVLLLFYLCFLSFFFSYFFKPTWKYHKCSYSAQGPAFAAEAGFMPEHVVLACDGALPAVVFTFSGAAWLLSSQLKWFMGLTDVWYSWMCPWLSQKSGQHCHSPLPKLSLYWLWNPLWQYCNG